MISSKPHNSEAYEVKAAWAGSGAEVWPRTQPPDTSLASPPSLTVTTMRVLAACALFTGAVSAVDVYLHPPSALSFASGSAPSPERASLTISQYFGLEFADALDEGSHVFLDEVGGAKNFVSQGQEDGLLLTINEEDAQGAALLVRRGSTWLTRVC
jgi:hypothetical protein